MKPVQTYYELHVTVYNIVSSTLNISDYMKLDIFYIRVIPSFPQVFETYKGMPKTSMGKFKVEFMNPLSGSMMAFTISPQSFKGKNDQEVRESISKQVILFATFFSGISIS